MHLQCVLKLSTKRTRTFPNQRLQDLMKVMRSEREREGLMIGVLCTVFVAWRAMLLKTMMRLDSTRHWRQNRSGQQNMADGKMFSFDCVSAAKRLSLLTLVMSVLKTLYSVAHRILYYLFIDAYFLGGGLLEYSVPRR